MCSYSEDKDILVVSDLTFSQGEKEILKGINLTVKREEIHSLLGVNGVGKSSLAYCLMGLNGYNLKKGKIYFEGKDITNLSIYQRARLGITLSWQEPAKFEGLTVRKYLFLSAGSNKSENLAVEALSRVGLKPRLYLDRDLNEALSGGERKRIELASIYAMQPKLAILDEPDSGIDMLSLEKIVDFIYSLNKRGSSVLIVTHREEIAEISDNASLMCDGRIIKSGRPKEIGDYFKSHCKQVCGPKE